jgi:hypothetical protein
MNRYVVYLLRIFKMFHELMNNPVVVLMKMVDDGGGGGGGSGDDGVIMPTMTTLTAKIQLLKLFLFYFEGARFAEVYLI